MNKVEDKETAGSPRNERAEMKPSNNMLEEVFPLALVEPPAERRSGRDQFGAKQWAERRKSSAGRADPRPEDLANLKTAHQSRQAASGLLEANGTQSNASPGCKCGSSVDEHTA